MSDAEDNGSPPPVKKKKKLWFKRPTRPAPVEKEKVEVDKATSTSTIPSPLQSSPPTVKREGKATAAEPTAAPLPVDGGDEDVGGKKGIKPSTRRKGSKPVVDAADFFIRSEDVYTAILADEKKQRAKKKDDGRKRKSDGPGEDACEVGEIEMEEAMDDDGNGLARKGRRKPRKATSWKDRKVDYEIISLDSDDGQNLDGDEDEDEEKEDTFGLYDDLEDEQDGISLRKRGRKGRKGLKKGTEEDDITAVKNPLRRRSLTPPPQILPPLPSTSISTSQAHSRQTPTPSLPPPPPSQYSQRKPGVPLTITLESSSEDEAGPVSNDLPPPPLLPDLEARARALTFPPTTTLLHTSETSINKTTNQPNLDPTSSTTVLINSPLPHTRPLLAKIRLNQKLRAVRLAWCRYQLTPKQLQAGVRIDESEIFLTYKGRKVFDANTSLGIGAGSVGDENKIDWGEISSTAEDKKVGIVFFAVDEATFRKMREEELNASLASTSASTANPSSTNPAADDVEIQPSQVNYDPDEDEPEDGSIRLILRGKGIEDCKIKIKPETKVERIIATLVGQREKLKGKDVVLKFDGDEVDPQGKVGDVEWEDRDVVEIWVK